jgi:hypothetical protein
MDVWGVSSINFQKSTCSGFEFLQVVDVRDDGKNATGMNLDYL